MSVCVCHNVHVYGWGYKQNPGYGVRSEHVVLLAISGGIVSSGDVSNDTWTCSKHYVGFAN